MPEYLAPGVYVEEVSFRAKSIEGVSTTTTGFIGPARYGPVDLEPDIVTSLNDFEAVYGDGQQLQFGSDTLHNFLWHAVRAFFAEGGKRLYIARIFRPLDPKLEQSPGVAAKTGNHYNDGCARKDAGSSSHALHLRARFPGAMGNLRVRLTVRLSQNVLGQDPGGAARVRGLLDHDVVWINDVTSPIASPPGSGELYQAESVFDETLQDQSWQFTNPAATTLQLGSLTPHADPKLSDNVRVVTLTVTITPGPGAIPQVWDGLPPDPRHRRAGEPDSLLDRFHPEPKNLGQARTVPLVITADSAVDTGLEVLEALFAYSGGLRSALNDPDSTDADRSIDLLLDGGNDGLRPGAREYEGLPSADSTRKTGLTTFEDLEDISILAAPGSTYGFEDGYRTDASTILGLLIAHASKMRYRIAVLDSGDKQSISAVRAMRSKIDSSYAALYYPWVRVLDPITRTEIHLPPSGFVAGIFARNDVQRAVYKAPANEVVNLAIGFELLLNKAQQDVLNPEGVNCFRFFEGRGYRLWGARTASSDPEWKYVNLRRYFAYLERSIDRGTQWAVFEPNGEALWANVRRTVDDFLLNEWQAGALLGDKPEKAFFVRCDRSTMTQNDLDNGRLIVLVGVAPLRPAEFVIFRIGQWTADRKS